MLIGEGALKHQELLAFIMDMGGKAGARGIAYNRGGARHFAADAIEHQAVDAGQGRGNKLFFPGQ